MTEKWKPIETLLKGYQRILVCGGNVGQTEIAYACVDGGVVVERYEDRRVSTDPPDRPSHWMPLPSEFKE